jgi:glycosyltransferase involved in cell wall biosynthesis
MKILIVNTYHYLRGGDSKYAFDLGDLLKKEGHEVHFFGMKSEKNLQCLDDQYFVTEIDYREALKRKKVYDTFKVIWRSVYSVEAKRNIHKILQNIRPDIVHLNAFQPHLTISILPEIYKQNIPMVLTIHAYGQLCPNTSFYDGQNICEDCKGKNYLNVIKKKCKKGSLAASIVSYLKAKIDDYLGYDRFISIKISPSMFLKDKYAEHGYNSDKLVHLPNFLELNTIVPNYDYEDYILFIGRLEVEKGLVTLIRGFAKATEDIKSLKLKIAGTGSMEEELRTLIGRMNLSNIELLGYKKGKELENLTKNAKAVVVPSEWYENYPYSCLEAMAYGKPVIASRIGGLPEQVEDGVTGLLFEPYSAEQLANAIRILNGFEKNRIVEIGKKARKKVENNNSPETHLKAIYDIYESLLKNK